jgi:hypothetical protein
VVAAHYSWRCVQLRAREQRLALVAEDVTIEDPIGIGPTNRNGKGFRVTREPERRSSSLRSPSSRRRYARAMSSD